jgi:subtilisin-like proprotein convertase family protein
MRLLNRLTRAARRTAPARRGADALKRHRFLPQVEGLEERAVPAGLLAVGTDAGVPATVRIFTDADLNGTYETLAPKGVAQPLDFAPYGGFTGGVRVALGDFDGDGNDELVTASGPGGPAHVIVWGLNPDGSIGAARDSFLPFDSSFTGGAFVAAGDLDGDGRDELAVSADAGGGSHVIVYSDVNHDGRLSDEVTDQLIPFPGFGGGARLAFGDTNNSLGDELIVGAGPGSVAQVIVYTDANHNRVVGDEPALESFLAYDASFSGGVYVAAGQVQNVGSNGAEIITGAGAGSSAHVRIFTDSNNNGLVSDNPLFEEFVAYGGGFAGGVRVAAGDTDNSGSLAEVVTASGPGSSHVQIFDDTFDKGSFLFDNAPTDLFLAYPAGYSAGAFVAFGKVRIETYAYAGFPQSIFDDATITSSLVVPAGAGRIIDVDVNLDIFHGFDGDLDVTLTHVPSGTSLELFHDVGGTNEGFFIQLSDESGTDIGSASNAKLDGAIHGSFNPQGTGQLSVFDGLDASGEWRLTITDDTPGDTGTLFGWNLRITF